ncbi:MAG: M1 family metallopeptidase [Bacteroidia bacterium]|nr:M1 family metallopeptidase [Bacteroidia bacterium]
MRLKSILFLLILLPGLFFGQGHQKRYQALDVLSYHFEIEIGDDNDRIEGKAALAMQIKQDMETIELDFQDVNEGKGMKIERMEVDGKLASFSHEKGILRITPREPLKAGSKINLLIQYGGVPADGLIIGKNKHGDRTFFGDNWPNRAHHYLPCVDHPSDKATVEFLITAPSHYQVVANGTLVEQSCLENGKMLSHWKTDYVLPTKVMVFGAAPFAVQNLGLVGRVPMSTWVFRQDREAGFYDYALAAKILPFFVGQVDNYPFDKLANVQSKTRYGGMENASCIFYAENSVDGKRTCEDLLAHEIAHQWFGNSASEANWHHIWLSEGFATYFTHLWFEKQNGKEALAGRMKKDRETIRAYHAKKQAPVVDTTVTNWNELLNPNSYQKGSWVLHMLRDRIGDEFFVKSIRVYYERYKYGNALTNELQRIMETESRKDLKKFFQQWLFTPGHPVLKVTAVNKKDRVDLTVEQTQANLFEFPLEIEIYFKGDESPMLQLVQVKDRKLMVSLGVSKEVDRVVLDPRTVLLFEEK